ncbi:ABC-type hemin transport system ATPase subunit [Actinopolyspora lacussalsi]|nr:ABC-type hemin transport system ATPase subunit [Actinopolyspora lacussalsi]
MRHPARCIFARPHAGRDRSRRAATVLTAPHELNPVADFRDRIRLLAAGETVAIGASAEALTDLPLSEVYGGHTDIGTHPRTGAPTVLFGN